jgi:hypothetical protein
VLLGVHRFEGTSTGHVNGILEHRVAVILQHGLIGYTNTSKGPRIRRTSPGIFGLSDACRSRSPKQVIEKDKARGLNEGAGEERRENLLPSKEGTGGHGVVFASSSRAVHARDLDRKILRMSPLDSPSAVVSHFKQSYILSSDEWAFHTLPFLLSGTLTNGRHLRGRKKKTRCCLRFLPSVRGPPFSFSI